MKILALDTTGTVASVALMNETKMMSEMTSNHLKNHSETVMPMVKRVLEMGTAP